jgi:adenine-specific DNA-methyltransferase
MKMDGKPLDIKLDKLNQLKELFPEVFTEDKVDWEKLKATLGEDIGFSNERYVLNWAGKSDAFRVLQTPTTATLVPDRKELVNLKIPTTFSLKARI